MNVALQRPFSAADLNFNPARLPLERLVAFAREHWGVMGDFTPLEGERDQNHRVIAADGTSHVLKVSAAGESEGAVDFQVAALRHLERCVQELPVPRVIASKAGKDLEWIVAADGTRHMVRLLSWIPGMPVSQGGACAASSIRMPGISWPGTSSARCCWSPACRPGSPTTRRRCARTSMRA
jgi:Ser/Thr protein kinase RdoA (MazF antagonist)